MKLGIAERMSPCEGWEDGEPLDTRTTAYISGVTATVQDDEDDDEEEKSAKKRTRARRVAA